MIVKKDTLVKAAKVGGLVGVGMVAAKVGGFAARSVSKGINDFAMKSETNAAIVDAGGGLVLAGGGLMLAAKFRPKAIGAAPFVLGGVVVATVLPRIIDKAVSFIGTQFQKVLPKSGGYVELPRLNRASSGALLPAGGLFAFDTLGGELSRAGGMFADAGDNLGGEIRRPGGMYAGASLGGEIARY